VMSKRGGAILSHLKTNKEARDRVLGNPEPAAEDEEEKEDTPSAPLASDAGTASAEPSGRSRGTMPARSLWNRVKEKAITQPKPEAGMMSVIRAAKMADESEKVVSKYEVSKHDSRARGEMSEQERSLYGLLCFEKGRANKIAVQLERSVQRIQSIQRDAEEDRKKLEERIEEYRATIERLKYAKDARMAQPGETQPAESPTREPPKGNKFAGIVKAKLMQGNTEAVLKVAQLEDKIKAKDKALSSALGKIDGQNQRLELLAAELDVAKADLETRNGDVKRMEEQQAAAIESFRIETLAQNMRVKGAEATELKGLKKKLASLEDELKKAKAALTAAQEEKKEADVAARATAADVSEANMRVRELEAELSRKAGFTAPPPPVKKKEVGTQCDIRPPEPPAPIEKIVAAEKEADEKEEKVVKALPTMPPPQRKKAEKALDTNKKLKVEKKAMTDALDRLKRAAERAKLYGQAEVVERMERWVMEWQLRWGKRREEIALSRSRVLEAALGAMNHLDWNYKWHYRQTQSPVQRCCPHGRSPHATLDFAERGPVAAAQQVAQVQWLDALRDVYPFMCGDCKEMLMMGCVSVIESVGADVASADFLGEDSPHGEDSPPRGRSLPPVRSQSSGEVDPRYATSGPQPLPSLPHGHTLTNGNQPFSQTVGRIAMHSRTRKRTTLQDQRRAGSPQNGIRGMMYTTSQR